MCIFLYWCLEHFHITAEICCFIIVIFIILFNWVKYITFLECLGDFHFSAEIGSEIQRDTVWKESLIKLFVLFIAFVQVGFLIISVLLCGGCSHVSGVCWQFGSSDNWTWAGGWISCVWCSPQVWCHLLCSCTFCMISYFLNK